MSGLTREEVADMIADIQASTIAPGYDAWRIINAIPHLTDQELDEVIEAASKARARLSNAA